MTERRMPEQDVRQLSGVEDVHRFVKRVCFKTGPPGIVGIETEWFVVDPRQRDRPVAIPELERALAGHPMPRRSLVTFEPGGQLELSSAAAPDLSTACRNIAADLRVAREAVADAGFLLYAQGTDPHRQPRIQNLGPRYDAMRRFFGRHGVEGEAMMSSTAAIQISLDAGADAADVCRRWRLAHSLVPVLLALFANSPFRFGRRTGLRSSRYAIWTAIDPTRTGVPEGDDPAEAYARYALGARVMLVRTATEPWVADPGFTFEDWVTGRTALPPPTVDDLEYHLTTLFPPVRPRGWFELRCLDALPDGLWQIATAVTTALVEDRGVSDAVAEAAAAVDGMTSVAMRNAVAEPRLRASGLRCLELAATALPRLGAIDLVPAVEAFREHYTERGRSPADDLLDCGDARWHRPANRPFLDALPPDILSSDALLPDTLSPDALSPDALSLDSGRHALWP
jgi:glutamate--cysteine ligase